MFTLPVSVLDYFSCSFKHRLNKLKYICFYCFYRKQHAEKNLVSPQEWRRLPTQSDTSLTQVQCYTLTAFNKYLY